MLKDGNARFAQGEMLKRNLRQHVKATGGGQFPFAAIVGCIGSRVPNELIFDQGMVDKGQISLAGDMYDVHNGKVTFM